jgi:hypothetical protein
MPVEIDDIEIMTDDGRFTENLAPSLFGEEYKDSKEISLERVPDVVTLGKRFLETKSALDRKLENVIQKPGKDATEEQVKEYKQSLKKELGAPETVDAYEFTPPEGVEHDENLVAAFKEAFLSEGVAPDAAARLVSKWDELQAAQVKSLNQAQQDAYEAEATEFKDSHPGDKLLIGGRTAAKMLLQFGNDEVASLIKDNKIMDDPGNLDTWRNMGFTPNHVAFFERVGEAMKSDTAITNEGEPTSIEAPKEGTQEAVVHKAYDHPTSVAARKARGKTY